MTHKTILTLLMMCFMLLTLVTTSFAQNDNVISLRELADANDLYIGAAVYTSHLVNPTHEDVLASQFNMLTPENEAKFCELQPQRGQFDFRQLDRLVSFAEANNMTVRGHTLLWHQCMPDWVANGDFSREEAINIMRDHIYTVVGRYKERIPIWDVVNEAIDGSAFRETPWFQFIGEDYVDLAFQFAHEADPDALLFYNDYGAEGLNPKAHAIYDMVAGMVERGIPIHGVGLQGHINVGDTQQGQWLQPANVAQNIARLGELGLEVQITEMDVKYPGEGTDEILQDQAADYYRFMQLCLDSEYCTAFIVWGVSDQLSWLRQPEFYDNPTVQPLLFDGEYNAKPAYFAVADALARQAGLPPVLSDDERDALVSISETTIEVSIPDPTMSSPDQLAPDPVDGIAYYAPYPVTISLDGDLADWANIPTVLVDTGPVLPEDHDTALTFAVAADDMYIYVLADVQDSAVVYGNYDPASEWYQEDSVEFYLNTTGDLLATAYSSGIVQIGISAANVEGSTPPLVGGGNSADSEIEVFATITDDGYLIEAAIPLETAVWTIALEHQAMLGFQVHLNGSSGDSRDTKLIWSIYDTEDQSYNNPSLFGRLIFWDTAQE